MTHKYRVKSDLSFFAERLERPIITLTHQKFEEKPALNVSSEVR
jgi:hypothetical protein